MLTIRQGIVSLCSLLVAACAPAPEAPGAVAPAAPATMATSVPATAAEGSPAANDAPPASEVSPPVERADVATPRQQEHSWMSLAEWRKRHERQLHAENRARAEVVFLGDSITEGWQQSTAYARHFGQFDPLNLGIGGDQTQHVLWRIDQGALDGVPARVVVILIGVNNLGNGHTPDETVRGIQAVVGRVAEKLPKASIVLLDILPAGELPDDALRQKVLETNQKLADQTWPPRVSLEDVGAVLVEPDGHIDKSVMGDFLHPTDVGYERFSGAVQALIAQALKRSGK